MCPPRDEVQARGRKIDTKHRQRKKTNTETVTDPESLTQTDRQIVRENLKAFDACLTVSVKQLLAHRAEEGA